MTSSAGSRGLIFFGVAAHPRDGVAHGREIGDGGHAGEILQQHSRRHKGDFRALFCDGLPFGQALYIVGVHEAAVFLAQQVFEQNANGEGNLADVPDSPALQRVEAIDFVADRRPECIARAERIFEAAGMSESSLTTGFLRTDLTMNHSANSEGKCALGLRALFLERRENAWGSGFIAGISAAFQRTDLRLR